MCSVFPCGLQWEKQTSPCPRWRNTHCPPFWACVCSSIRKSPLTHLPFPTLTCRTFPNVDLSPPRYPPMIDWYLTCNRVMPLQSFCLPLLDVGIDSLQEHLEIHLQKYSIRLVVFCLEE